MEEITQLFDIGELMLLTASPILGFILNYTLPRNKLKWVLIPNLIFLIPSIFGYDFILSWAYELNLTLILSVIFSFFISGIKSWLHNIILSVGIGISLFCIIGYFDFLDAFAGHQTVLQSWEKDSYTIQHVKDQGFSGKPLMKYDVFHTPLFGIYSKHIQTSNNRLDSCLFYFDDAKLLFDRCEGKIVSTSKNSIYFDCKNTPNTLSITGQINNSFIPATSHKLDAPQRLETLKYIQEYQENKHGLKLDTYFALLHHHDSTRANNIIKADSILSKTNEFGTALVYTFENMEQLDILFKPLIQSNQLDGLISCTVEQLNQLKPYLNSDKKVSLKIKLIGCAEMDYTVFYKLEDIQTKKNE